MIAIGLHIRDLRMNCAHHPNDYLVVGEGKGPHAYRLTCSTCGRFVGWVSKQRAADLDDGVRRSREAAQS
jgi:hypothetical protein